MSPYCHVSLVSGLQQIAVLASLQLLQLVLRHARPEATGSPHSSNQNRALAEKQSSPAGWTASVIDDMCCAEGRLT